VSSPPRVVLLTAEAVEGFQPSTMGLQGQLRVIRHSSTLRRKFSALGLNWGLQMYGKTALLTIIAIISMAASASAQAVTGSAGGGFLLTRAPDGTTKASGLYIGNARIVGGNGFAPIEVTVDLRAAGDGAVKGTMKNLSAVDAKRIRSAIPGAVLDLGAGKRLQLKARRPQTSLRSSVKIARRSLV